MNQIKTNFFIRLTIMILLFSTVSNCGDEKKEKTQELAEKGGGEEQLYRPNFHFTPKNNWMNDPNGMFYLDGAYHLFFQYYPDDNVWGPMHWGHAVSKDLVNWDEKEIALFPDSLGYIFSGSAVVDQLNTSGFGNGTIPPVISIFTYHDPKGEQEDRIDFQYQAIAFSNDKGESWTKYEGNPVLPNPGIKDFRDPKVVWDARRQQWVMALATYSETYFYGSKDLKSWSFLSSFGKDLGAHGGVWECPDLFPMRVTGSEETKWVLIQSLNPGSANGGSGTQYFIGDFDGKTFSLDPDFKNQLDQHKAIWLDFGRDNYAGVTWSNIPKEDGRTLFIGWMSNWDYAQVVPTETWRSAMTIARELILEKDSLGYKLKSIPAREFMDHVNYKPEQRNLEIDGPFKIAGPVEANLSNAVIEISFKTDTKANYTFELSNDFGNILKFGLDNQKQSLFIDRQNSGKTEFSQKFASSISYGQLRKMEGELELLIILDKTSIELFAEGGGTVMTEIFFPDEPMTHLTLTASDNTLVIKSVAVGQLER